jgi:uncharacterized protein YfaS (alpha-2-macroglobulin family)
MHLDYGLKGSSGYAKNASADAVDCTTGAEALIPNHDSYPFVVTGAQTGVANIANINVFKRNPGVAGVVRSGASATPVIGAKIKLLNAKGALLLSALTDEDGFYQLAYKHTGKAATYYVSLVMPSGHKETRAVVVAANKYVNVDFSVP